jgi:hypothetical protein
MSDDVKSGVSILLVSAGGVAPTSGVEKVSDWVSVGSVVDESTGVLEESSVPAAGAEVSVGAVSVVSVGGGVVSAG